MQSTLSLTGKYSYTNNNLFGKQFSNAIDIPQEIKNIKIQILDTFLIPLVKKNWKVLKENIFFLEKIKNKLNNYYNTYKSFDLLMYSEVLNSLEIFMSEHREFEKLEQKLYLIPNNNVMSSIVYKTKPIKLKPEYEIYDFIFGNPKDNQEVYNLTIINEIQTLLNKDNVDFNKIKTYLLNKYPDKIYSCMDSI